MVVKFETPGMGAGRPRTHNRDGGTTTFNPVWVVWPDTQTTHRSGSATGKELGGPEEKNFFRVDHPDHPDHPASSGASLNVFNPDRTQTTQTID